MKDLDALIKIYRMAYHANDLKGMPWTDEEKEALGAARRYIEVEFPLAKVDLWNVDRGYFDTRTNGQKQSGPNYVPIGGTGNGA